MTFNFTRSWAVTSKAQGTIAAINSPVFSPQSCAIAGAPSYVDLITDNTATNIAAAGYTLDDEICILTYNYKSAPNAAYVDIHVDPDLTTTDSLETHPTLSFNIRCVASGNKTTSQVDLLKGTPDEDANKIYEPIGFTVVHGVVLALCSVSGWTGSAWQIQKVAVCYIYISTGTQWALLYEGATINAGQTRGREWITTQFWPLDGLPQQQSTEVFLTWTDYQINPGGTGGQLHGIRLARSSANDDWDLPVCQPLLEETGVTPNRHWHNAIAYRTAAGNINILLVIGDSNQAELIGIYRSDSSTFDEGASGTTPTASMTHGATSNGWTTVREVAGCPTVLGNSPATGWNQSVGFALHPNGTDFILSNDEGQQPVFIMTPPDLAGGETKAYFYAADCAMTTHSLRRGWVNFVMSSIPGVNDFYASMAYRNSAAQASTGAKNEKYRLIFTPGGSASGTLTITDLQSGQTTAAITYSGTPATIQADIDAKLEALTGFGAGSIDVSNISANNYDITLQGTLASTTRTGGWTVNGAGLTDCTVTIDRRQTGNGNTIPCSLSGSSGGYPQGFSAAITGETARILGSYDGDKHFVLAAPNIQNRLVVDPEQGVLAGGVSSWGKLRRYAPPPIMTGQPLVISPAASSNKQISTVTQVEAPSAGNTWTSVNPDTQLGIANSLGIARLIAKPPCNGPVFRWTVNGTTATSKYGGVHTVTTATPIPASPSQANIKIRLWGCMVPVNATYGGDNVAPFNSPRCSIRIQPMRAGTGQTAFAAAGDVDSMDSTGWFPIIIETTTSLWASYVTAATNLSLRFTDPSTGATNMDLLIAFDQVIIEAATDSDNRLDLCAHPAPVGASASTMGNEECYLGNLPTQNSDDWSAMLIGVIPEGAYDQFMPEARRPVTPRLFTLMTGVDELYAYFDFANRAFVLADGSPESISPISGEAYAFLPGDPVLIGFSKTGSTLTYAVSICGTTVQTGTMSISSNFNPDTLYLANSTYPIAAMKWHKISFNKNRALSAAELTTALQTLNLPA